MKQVRSMLGSNSTSREPFREPRNRSRTFQDPPALNAFARYVVAPCPEIVMVLTSGFTTSTIMILITVMYPAGPEDSFDRGYYLETHIPLVKERWSSMGLESVQLLRGIASGEWQRTCVSGDCAALFP